LAPEETTVYRAGSCKKQHQKVKKDIEMHTVHNYKLSTYTSVANRVIQQCHW